MKWVLGGILVVGALILLGTYYTFRKTFYYRAPKQIDMHSFTFVKNGDKVEAVVGKDIDRLANAPCEVVRIKSYDGLTLTGRYYHVEDGAPLRILFHGYKGAAVRDMSGGFTIAMKRRHNVLLVDQRAHGDSEGRVISFGIKERHDVLSWVLYANGRFGSDVPIILSGVSMGGATVLHALSLDLPENVKGVISDCPYSSPEQIIYKTCKEMGYPPRLAMPLIKLGARLYGGFRLEGSAVEAVRSAKIPCLLIHGEADDFIPYKMSEEIMQAYGGECRLELFPNATHGLSYVEDPVRYDKIEEEFVNQILN